ncbi:MAG: hypothetical protein E4H39_00775 [Syntrophobacterales bacterium]|nr:MAG: hypothetical protein E4H39_00775 [Syntrophobacterales bacterium]
MMSDREVYPYSLKTVLEQNEFENIMDNNMFSAFIPDNLPIPAIDEPRNTQSSGCGVARHPEYLRYSQINQIFSYIGYIKRTGKSSFRKYLPLLFDQLNIFLSVFEKIIFTMDVMISEDIYLERKLGLENFLEFYKRRSEKGPEWLEEVWRRQKHYLEQLDMLTETLKVRGHVFDFSDDPMFDEIITLCRSKLNGNDPESPNDVDYGFVTNVCLKAYSDREPKTIWSGDRHVLRILDAIYNRSDLKIEFPRVNLRATYSPRNFAYLFPLS